MIDLAFTASEELRLMAQEREPLWIFDVDKGSEALNMAEYNRRFASLDPSLEQIIRFITKGDPSDLSILNEKNGLPSENGFISSCMTENTNSEASRAIGVVFRNPISLVNMFMDVDKWSEIFSNIVSKAINLAVLSAGNKENPNGSMQVMMAEFHVPCPLAKAQKMYFVRYTRQIDSSTWVVADVSLEAIFPTPSPACQRKPSGCFIQALQDGLSVVTWVEHNTVLYNDVVHYMSKGLLRSGSAFSAKRWISSLERQYDRIATLEANNVSTSSNIPSKEGIGIGARNGLLKLAARMVRRFNSNIFSNGWRALGVAGAEEIMIKTRCNVDDPEIPAGVAVTIATSVWLPAKHIDVFSFLQNEHNRNKWDILSDGLEIEEVIRISSARNSTDIVSVISVQSSSARRGITYLQESFSDSTAHYVVYSPVDVPMMHHILRGSAEDSEGIYILPSGFAVIPYEDGKATVLIVAFEVMELMDQQQLIMPSQDHQLSSQSLFVAYSLVTETISRIRTALLPKL
ncbi:hypothetical protein CDL12_14977 [Handroanthus impetiginosus]|uniref:START domain-containing protein n=1 Tax=Handroanthus impetiginosus TaxID=429701 RepID=A0A2G9H4J0_9LAMI|nr:hypothetical protein CDL12_14977 [Handroanthus impetiginosus]